MKIHASVALSLLTIGAHAQSAYAQSGARPPANEKEVRAYYTRMSALLAKKDAKGALVLFERVTAPGFIAFTNRKRVTRREIFGTIRSNAPAKQSPITRMNVVSSRVERDRIVLRVEWTHRGIGPGGKPDVLRQTFTDVWRRTPKGYLYSTSTEAGDGVVHFSR